MKKIDKVMLLLLVAMGAMLVAAQTYPPEGFAGAGGALLAPLEAGSGCSPPYYGFSGDPNTGMCSSAADTLDFIAGGAGVAEMQFDRAAWTLNMFNNAGDASTQWTFTNNIGQTTTFQLGPGALPFRLTTHNGSNVDVDIDGNLLLQPTAFAAFAALTPANGALRYCSDCTKTTPCAGAGTGAFAVRLNGAWDCNL